MRKQRTRSRFQSLLSAIAAPLNKGSNKARRPTRAPRQSEANPDRNDADRIILFTTAALVIFGWIMVYSGSFYVASQQKNTIFTAYNPYHFFILQGIWITLGSMAGYLAFRLPLKFYKILILPGLITIVSLLVIVLFLPGTINGAKLWIKLGPFSLQPSEFAKPLIILYLASLFAKLRTSDYKDYANYFQKKVLPFSLVIAPIVALVLAGSDLAGAGLMIMIAGGMFFMADNHRYTNYTVVMLVISAVIFAITFTTLEPYRMERVETYVDAVITGQPRNPLSSGYQLTQILTAVGSGGFSGYGFGQSRQKYFYLQETAFNDTIFAVIAEEFGFIGSIAVIASFYLLISRALKVAQACKNRFAAYTALGIALWLFLQSLIHLGVNVGMIPLTGITLPFMSYGGSSLIASLITIGILLNVSKEVKLD